MARNYGSKGDAQEARVGFLERLAGFLGWPNGACETCFGDWRESTKDPKEVLGADSVAVLREHMKWMEGVWPPPGDEGAEEQRCGI